MSKIENNNRPIIIIGPTASGKSRLAIEIADKLDGEIINADSMQIYSLIPIISSQPTKQDKQNYQHHLYGFIDQEKSGDDFYSAGKWVSDCKIKIEAIISRNKLPIIVGGTGFYISSLLDGIAKIPNISPEQSKNTEILLSGIGIEKFYEHLIEIDPLVKDNIHKNDRARLIRAYNVIMETGISIYDWQKNTTDKYFADNYFYKILVSPDKELLKQNIYNRFDSMIENGAIEEVKNLILHGVNSGNITKAIGIREIMAFLEGKLTKEDAIILAKVNTRQYAKRQSTWFRNKIKNIDLIINK